MTCRGVSDAPYLRPKEQTKLFCLFIVRLLGEVLARVRERMRASTMEMTAETV